MQRKLSQWATQDKNKQFYGLYDLLYDKENLQTLCETCHRAKTQSDHQRESPARRKLHTGFGGRSEETTSVSNIDTHQQN